MPHLILNVSIILLIIFFIIMLISFICYLKAFYNNKKVGDIYSLPGNEQYLKLKDKMDDIYFELEKITFEEVTIISHDGKKLFGKYYHISDNAPLQIQFHGYKGSGNRDFCGGNKLARESGFSTLLVDQRAHGKSEGRTITFGIKERLDCLSWIEYANKRFNNKPIIIAGLSMGASTVLMASNLELPHNVIGIIADCPYSSPKEIIYSVCKNMGIPPKLAFPFIKLGGLVFGRFDIEELDCIKAVENSKVPILIIHGNDDRFVPYTMSEKIASASNNITLKIFENAGHGLSYMVDTEKYKQIVNDFINECYKKNAMKRSEN